MSWEMHEAAKRIVDGWYAELEDTRKRNAVLGLENARLRELVRDMYRRFHGVVIENWSYSSEDFYTYEQRMRELGVEVDE